MEDLLRGEIESFQKLSSQRHTRAPLTDFKFALREALARDKIHPLMSKHQSKDNNFQFAFLKILSSLKVTARGSEKVI